MKEFKIGQRVKIVNETAAREFFVGKPLGHEFKVDAISEATGNAMADFGLGFPYFIPPEACELVEPFSPALDFHDTIPEFSA